jgi:TolB protein
MTRSARRLAALLLTAGLAAAAAAPAGATLPGPNGRIAFAQLADPATGTYQLYTANSDGSDQQAVEYDAQESSWSSDGRLVYDHLTSNDTVDLFVLEPDRTKRQITHDAGINVSPGFSPDGETVVFESDRGDYPADEGIYTMRTDGTHLQRLTSTPSNALYDTGPRFSPDGNRIVFFRQRESQHRHGSRYAGLPVGNLAAIYVMNADGSGLKRITAWGHDLAAPDWSPDGTRLVYSGVWDARPGTLNEIYTMRPDGTDVRQVTQNHRWTHSGSSFELGSAWDPTWSPDGRRILYIQFDGDEVSGAVDLWTIKPDGSDAHPAFVDDAFDSFPSWGPLG